MLGFGSWLFIGLSVMFLVAQIVLMFRDSNRASLGVLAAYAAALFFLVDDWPTFNYRWLVVYPALALLWLPVYWYLDLIRRASRIKSLVIQHGNLKNVYRTCGRSVTRDIESVRDNDGVTFHRANIQHPPINDLLSNCLLFPVSIPLFFGENAVRMTIDYLRQWMEQVRLKINESVNNFRG